MTNSAKSINELLYLTDGRKNVICVPYSVENLHRMAHDLGIGQSCFFKNDHYTIPESMVDEIEQKCEKVTTQTLFKTAKNIMVV